MSDSPDAPTPEPNASSLIQTLLISNESGKLDAVLRACCGDCQEHAHSAHQELLFFRLRGLQKAQPRHRQKHSEQQRVRRAGALNHVSQLGYDAKLRRKRQIRIGECRRDLAEKDSVLCAIHLTRDDVSETPAVAAAHLRARVKWNEESAQTPGAMRRHVAVGSVIICSPLT